MPNSFVYKQLASNKLAIGKKIYQVFLWSLQNFLWGLQGFLWRIDTAVQPIRSLYLLQVGSKYKLLILHTHLSSPLYVDPGPRCKIKIIDHSESRSCQVSIYRIIILIAYHNNYIIAGILKLGEYQNKCIQFDKF